MTHNSKHLCLFFSIPAFPFLRPCSQKSQVIHQCACLCVDNIRSSRFLDCRTFHVWIVKWRSKDDGLANSGHATTLAFPGVLGNYLNLMFGLVVRWLKSPKIELLHNEAANVFPYELIFFLTNTEMNIQNIYIYLPSIGLNCIF